MKKKPTGHYRLQEGEFLTTISKAEERFEANKSVCRAWELFNNRTRMMKGLFNYETAFRAYIRLLLQNFVDEKILYAEIRPTFMSTNYLFTDKGKRLDNKGIMRIIVDEVTSFLKNRGQNGQVAGNGPFHGIKVIYCTPRSLPNKSIEVALRECREFNKLFPGWIAGMEKIAIAAVMLNESLY